MRDAVFIAVNAYLIAHYVELAPAGEVVPVVVASVSNVPVSRKNPNVRTIPPVEALNLM
jgi:hypothetical protein